MDSNNASAIASLSCPWRETFRERQAYLIDRWKTGGLFIDQDLDDINCHWLQFEPVPLVNHLLLAFVFFVVFLVGCFSNALVVYILTTSRQLWTPVNVIIANLALSDFFMLVKMPVFIYNSLVQGPALGYRGCVVYGLMSGVTGCASIMSLAAVAVERYLVINRPFRGNRKPTLGWAYVTVLFIWIYSSVFACLPLWGIGKYVPEGYLTSCSFDYLSDEWTTRAFILSFFLAAWAVPVTAITTCYVAVARYITSYKRQTTPSSQRQQPTEAQQADKDPEAIKCWLMCINSEVNTAKITFFLVALWMLSWTPYATVALLGISGHQDLLSPGVTMLPALFAKTSACINPFVYSLNHPKIKKEIARRFRCLMSGETSDSAGDNRGRYRSRGSPVSVIRFRSRIISKADGSDNHSSQYQSLMIRRQLAVSHLSNNLPSPEELCSLVNGPHRRQQRRDNNSTGGSNRSSKRPSGHPSECLVEVAMNEEAVQKASAPGQHLNGDASVDKRSSSNGSSIPCQAFV